MRGPFAHRRLPSTATDIGYLADVDLVFSPPGPLTQSLAIIHELRSAGIAAPVVGGDSYDSEALWQQHPDIDDVYFTTHAYLGADSPDAAVQRFRLGYAEAYGIAPDAFAALGYDSARLLAEAIDMAGSMHYPPGSRIPVKTVTVLRIHQGTLELFRQLIPAVVPPPA